MFAEYHKLITVPETKWNKIHSDYKGTYTYENNPDLMGNNSVMSGCISSCLSSLMVEKVHFMIVDDANANCEFFALNNGHIVEYIGKDNFYRCLFRHTETKRVSCLVEDTLHNITENGEPDSPLALSCQLRDENFSLFKFEEIQVIKYAAIRSTSLKHFEFAKDTVFEKCSSLILFELNSFKSNLSLIFDAESGTEFIYDLNQSDNDREIIRKYARLIQKNYKSVDRSELDLLVKNVCLDGLVEELK